MSWKLVAQLSHEPDDLPLVEHTFCACCLRELPEPVVDHWRLDVLCAECLEECE